MRTRVRGIPTPPRIQYLRTNVGVGWTEKEKENREYVCM
jgi:hypothetical protein